MIGHADGFPASIGQEAAVEISKANVDGKRSVRGDSQHWNVDRRHP